MIAARYRLAPRVICKFRPAAHLHAARLGAFAAFAGAGADQFALECGKIDGRQKALKDDPAASAVAAGWPSRVPGPIDYTKPDTAQGLAERANIVQGIAARQGGMPGSAILPNDLGPAKDVMA